MSKRWSYAAAVITLMSCSERSVPAGGCGGETCGEAQRCDLPTLRCLKNQRPRLTLSSPTTTISDASFQLTGTVNDDTEGTTLEWREGVAEWQAVEADSEGAFTITVAARELDEEPMYLTVRADDGTNQVERSIIVLVDRIGPKLELRSPLPGSVTGGLEASITILARDGSEGLQELKIADQSISSPRIGTEHTALIAIPPGDRRAFPVSVTAKDLNGNRSTQTFLVQVDGVGPALRFVIPSAAINTPSFRVEVEATDQTSVQQVRIAMEDGGFIEALPGDGGLWSAEFAIPVTERLVTFSAEATDTAGNKSSLVSAPVQIDRIAPMVEVTSPDVDSIHNRAFFVRAIAGADALSVTAAFAGTTVSLTRALDGSWQGQMPLTARRDYSEEFVVAVARDAAGNERASAPWRLFIDTVAPTLTFTTPAPNAKLNRTNFIGTDEVTIGWRVEDADPLAATVSVNGVPNTAPELRITTSPPDDGRLFTTTVFVADRKGNVTTGSLTFSVDRVAPSIVSWSPAANARNVEPRSTGITFSERVTGATTSSEAMAISPGTSQPGTWNSSHTTWTSADLAPYVVFTALLGNLADDSGNPVAVSSRKFHTAALVPTSGLVLATNVSSFTATSDSDGVLTVATTSSAGYRVFGLSPSSGAVQTASLSDPNVGTFSLNSSQTVDPATLIATHRVGSARYGGVGMGPLPLAGLVRHVLTNGVASAIGSTADMSGAVLSQGAFPGEADGAPFALLNGTTYLRGAVSRILPTSPNLVVAQSSLTWAGFSTSSTGVSWTRFLCIPSLVGNPTCSSFAFTAAASAPAELRAAIAPNNRCLVASWTGSTGRMVAFQPLALCDEPRPVGAPPHPSCQSNSVQATPSALSRFRAAGFSGNGEKTMLGAWESGGIVVGKMSDPMACANNFIPVGSPLTEPATDFEPVQLGNKAALLYIDASRNLKLYVP